MKSRKKSRLKAFINIVFLALSVLLMAAGSSWMADGLYPFVTNQESPSPSSIAFGFIAFVLGFTLAYLLRRKFLPVRVLSQSGEITPHRALIIPVSYPQGDWKNLSPDLKTALEGQKTNWQQILRTILPHRETIEEIHLIGSAADEKSSFDQLSNCAEFIRRYFQNVRIEHPPKPIPFENIEALTHTVNGIIDDITQRTEHPIDRKDIMLDATGGTKTVSIAMAMVTTRHPDLQFQYVTTDKTARPIAFNVVTETQVEVG